MNKICLVGNLTKDIEVRSTASGKKVCSFNLAVRRDKDNTDFIPCVAWEKTCELLEDYTSKGSKISIEGRNQTRNYTDKDGKKVYTMEVVAEKIGLLDKKSDGEKERVKKDDDVEIDVDKEFEDFGNSVELTDDDLAF